MQNIQNDLNGYIIRVCRDSCISEQRPVDVKFQYTIIDNMLVFAVEVSYEKVLRRIIYRLERNLYKYYKLLCCNVDDPKSWIRFLYGDINFNFSFSEWDVFGQWGTLVVGEDEKLNPHLNIRSLDIGEPSRCLKVLAAGYCPPSKLERSSLTSEDWQEFCRYYEKAFGDRPFVTGKTVVLHVFEDTYESADLTRRDSETEAIF